MVWFCVTTDQGSNEMCARKHCLVATSTLDQCLYLDANCLEHQSHLGVHAALVFIDLALREHGRSWKYYSSLAIFSNCARDLASSIFNKWTEFFGSDSALQTVNALIPKSSAGRWGAIDQIEGRFLRAPQHQWAQCMNHVILEKLQLDSSEIDGLQGILPDEVHRIFASKAPKKKGKAKGKAKAAARADESGCGKVDLLAIEEMAEHAARIGRWRRHLLLTMNDRLFGCLVEVMHVSRAPLIHLSNFLKQDISDIELNRHGNKLQQLVCFKAGAIMAEFDALLGNMSALSVRLALLTSFVRLALHCPLTTEPYLCSACR